MTPGFVDPHTHSDLSIIAPLAQSAVHQGVTTHVTGNCGMGRRRWSNAFATTCAGVGLLLARRRRLGLAQLRELPAGDRGAGAAINIAPLVGHGALRIGAMGYAERAATAKELDVMRRLLAEGMRAGAHGLSTGLVYPPGCFADTAEIVALCEVVAAYRGIYTSHIRGERETILEAVAEAIAIGRAAGVPVEVSHNAPKWGAGEKAKANLDLVEEARRGGST